MNLNVITVDTTGAAPLTAGISSPGCRTVVVEVRPDRSGLHVVAGDVLAALGKRRDISGKGRNEHDDIRHSRAWLHAHGTTDLILTHTQRLHAKMLPGLTALANETGVEKLWLLHETPRSDGFLGALTHLYPAAAACPDLPTAPPDGTSQDPVENTPTARRTPEVPRAEFTTFWRACQTQLDSTDLDLVGRRLARAVEHCDHHLIRTGANADTITALVFATLNAAPTDAELAIDIRGLQIAAWHRDLYVKVDHTRLHHHEERPRLSHQQVDHALRAYRQPYRALTAALARHGHGLEDLTRITLRDADPDTATIGCSGEEIPLTSTAATALRAQLHLLRTNGATDDDLLLPHSAKALSKALTDARIDLGIHLHGRRVERTRNHTTSALAQVGITVHSLP